MRQVVQIIKCDHCMNEVKEDETVFPHELNLDNTQYEFELCEDCEEVYADSLHLNQILDIARVVKGRPAKKSGGKKKSPFPYEPSDITEKDGRLQCPDCATSSETIQGLKMHWTRSHNYN